MKASAILVRLAAPLRFMPPQQLQAVDNFLFQWVQGNDAQHHARWRRMWRRMFHSQQQQPSLHLYELQDRSGGFHARHMTIEGRIYENQETFITRKAFRLWLKSGAAFGEYVASNGALVFEPSSLSYEEASDDDMREFHEDAMRFLRTPDALQTLWPHVHREQRLARFEAFLQDPNEDQSE